MTAVVAVVQDGVVELQVPAGEHASVDMLLMWVAE
jgi:hypothetical protein